MDKFTVYYSVSGILFLLHFLSNVRMLHANVVENLMLISMVIYSIVLVSGMPNIINQPYLYISTLLLGVLFFRQCQIGPFLTVQSIITFFVLVVTAWYGIALSVGTLVKP